MKRIFARFYRSSNGREPVREWLLNMDQTNRTTIGMDIKTAEYGWPIGMPIVRKMETNLWEIRSNSTIGIARVFFTVLGTEMVLLHGMIKKSQKTPKADLNKALKRLKEVHNE